MDGVSFQLTAESRLTGILDLLRVLVDRNTNLSKRKAYIFICLLIKTGIAFHPVLLSFLIKGKEQGDGLRF